MKRLLPVAAASLLLLSACGESSRPLQDSAGPVADQAVNDSIADQPVLTAAYREQPLDSDADGIADDADPNPHAAPEAPLAGTPLRIDTLISPRPNRDLHNLIMASEPVEINVTGLYAYGNPWWVRWHHAGGIWVEPVTPDATGRLRLTAPELKAEAVSVVAGHYVTEPHPVRSHMARAPLIYPVDQPIRAGNTVKLSGEYLDQVTHIALGNSALTLVSQQPESITVRLPEHPFSQQLTIEDDWGRSQAFALPVVRPVELVADEALQSPGDWQLLTDHAIHTPDEPFTLWIAAGETRVLRLTHDDRPVSLQALVLPGDRQIKLGGGSTLTAWLWRFRTGQGGSRPIDFASVLPGLTNQLASVHIRLTEALNGDFQAINDSRKAFNSQIHQLAWEQPIAAPEKMEPTPRWGILDYVGDTIDAIFAGGPLYEPIVNVANQRAKSGSDNYANIAVGYLRDLTSCGDLSTQPTGAWPSDLCLENDSALFVSARVIDWRSDEVLADHIQNPLDANIIGGNSLGILNVATVAYLSGSGGTLCKMRPCRIEVLTGGLGMGTTTNLNASERQVADWLLARTLIDRLIFPIIESVTGLDEDSDTLGCFAEELLKPSTTSTASFLITVSDFAQKVAQSNSESDVKVHIQETLIPIVLDKLYGLATFDDLEPCLANLAADVKNEVLDNVADRLEQVASSAALPIRVASALSDAYQFLEIASNPRRVVFDVAPRGAITEMTTSGNSRRELFFDQPTQYLRLRGTQLIDPLEGGYWPDLSLKDRAGSQVSMAITQDHVYDASDFSWVELHIPVSDLTPLINQLGGSQFDVDLVYTHKTYTGFPNEVLTIPGTSFRWFGDARLVGLDTGLIRAGESGVLRGESLEILQRHDLQLVLFNATIGTFSAESVRYVSGSKLVFTVPDYVPSGQYEMSVLAGDQPLLTAETDAQVLAANGSFIRLLDNGANQDDEIGLTLLNQQAGDLQPPDFNSSILLPTSSGTYDIWVGWEPGDLTDSSGQTQTLDELKVTCINGSDDGVCTVRLVAEIPDAGSSSLILDEQRTLSQGDELVFQ